MNVRATVLKGLVLPLESPRQNHPGDLASPAFRARSSTRPFAHAVISSRNQHIHYIPSKGLTHTLYSESFFFGMGTARSRRSCAVDFIASQPIGTSSSSGGTPVSSAMLSPCPAPPAAAKEHKIGHENCDTMKYYDYTDTGQQP